MNVNDLYKTLISIFSTVKSEPQSDEDMEVDTSKEPVKPVKPVTKPVTQPHQISVSQLFTPSEVN